MNCNKKYRDSNALVRHHNHSHRPRDDDDVIKHSISASGKKTTTAASSSGDRDGENRKRKCDDVTAASEVKCRRMSIDNDSATDRQIDVKPEVTSLTDRKSESAGDTHAQTSVDVSNGDARNDDDKNDNDMKCGGALSTSDSVETGQSSGSQSTRSIVDPRSATTAQQTTTASRITGQQLHAAAVEYIHLESMRQAYLQMIAASATSSPGRQLMTQSHQSDHQSEPVDMSSRRDRSTASTTTAAARLTCSPVVKSVFDGQTSPVSDKHRPITVSSERHSSHVPTSWSSLGLSPDVVDDLNNYHRPNSSHHHYQQLHGVVPVSDSDVIATPCISSETSTKHSASTSGTVYNDLCSGFTQRYLHNHHHMHLINAPTTAVFTQYPPS